MKIFYNNTEISVRLVKAAHILKPNLCKVALYESLSVKPNINGNYFVAIMSPNGDEYVVDEIYKYYLLRNAIVDYLDIILKFC